MDLVNAAKRCNDVEVFLVRMREKGLLMSIASACFKSADRIASNAGDDRQAPLGPFMEPTPRFSHEVSPSLSCRRFSIYAPLAPVVRIATNEPTLLWNQLIMALNALSGHVAKSHTKPSAFRCDESEEQSPTEESCKTKPDRREIPPQN